MKFLQFLGQTFRQNDQSRAQIAYLSVYFAEWKLKMPKRMITAMYLDGNWYRVETKKKNIDKCFKISKRTVCLSVPASCTRSFDFLRQSPLNNRGYWKPEI